MITRVLEASRTEGKLKVFCQAAMSRALKAAMKSSRQRIAAAMASAFSGMASSSDGGGIDGAIDPSRGSAETLRGRNIGPGLVSPRMFRMAFAAMIAVLAAGFG